MEFPTAEQVDKASHEQLARWYRFLLASNKTETTILDRVSLRLKEKGGMTPEISKKVGHGGV